MGVVHVERASIAGLDLAHGDLAVADQISARRLLAVVVHGLIELGSAFLERFAAVRQCRLTFIGTVGEFRARGDAELLFGRMVAVGSIFEQSIEIRCCPFT